MDFNATCLGSVDDVDRGGDGHVADGAGGPVPRRELCHGVPRAAADVRRAGGIPGQQCARRIALAVWTLSDGGGHRRFSICIVGYKADVVGSFGSGLLDFNSSIRERLNVLPQDGKNLRRCCMKDAGRQTIDHRPPPFAVNSPLSSLCR